jgi:hypothetical protein
MPLGIGGLKEPAPSHGLPPKPPIAQTQPVQALVLAFVLGLALLLAGCGPSSRASKETPPPSTPKSFLDDERPKTGLPRIKLYVGPEILDTELALTTEAIQKGMMWRTNVPETEAMLFVFGRPTKHPSG